MDTDIVARLDKEEDVYTYAPSTAAVIAQAYSVSSGRGDRGRKHRWLIGIWVMHIKALGNGPRSDTEYM